ncbi:MAG: hypothetical protein Kow00121_35040 [Elainellaceae cyanobacterium]
MNKLKNFLQSVKLSRVVVVFLAGVLLLVSTACSRPDSPRVSGESSYQDHRAQRTDFDASSPDRLGGMNQYRDNNRNTNATDLKAKRLIDNARDNTNKVNNTQDFVRNYREGTPLNERVENITDNVGEAASEVAEDLKEGTQKGIRNIRQNTGDAVDSASRNAEDASRSASYRAQDAAKATQRAARDAADSVSGRS